MQPYLGDQWSFTRKHQKDDRNGTWYMILQRFNSSSVFGLNTYIKLGTTAISMSFSVPGLVSCLQIFLLARLCVSGCESGACHDLRVVPSLCCDMWPPRPSSRPLIGHRPAYWPLIGQQPGHCCGNMLSPRSTQIIPNGEHKLHNFNPNERDEENFVLKIFIFLAIINTNSELVLWALG